ncbi:phosphate/phosphite/phosphonate ABC transporter substrate-binding protein [Aggregatilinea lenta]|uniref:phosphate/phosphite/phosphonate ABC transporter substrate-binding protein n=1 Tax=Aggregatilinea lenta TaxID=913108 RepID=UPI001EE9550D|nr:PhnD/SsuA/transferrin family substrate-binding protein [Aggregatilinea lenta]
MTLAGLVLSLSLAACSGSDEPVGRRTTAVPVSPTPRATPLPDVSPVAPLGSEGRPLTLIFVQPGDTLTTGIAAVQQDVQAYLLDELGLSVAITFVENESEALRAVCIGTEDGMPAAAWMSAFSAMVAERDCDAEPALAVVRGTGTRAAVGMPVEIVGRGGIAALDALRGQAMCRVTGDEDLVAWVYPSLLLAGAGIDPITDMPAPLDYASAEDVIRAIAEGDCAAAALEPGAYDDALDDLESTLPWSGGPANREELEAAVTVLRPAGDATAPRGTAWSGYAANVVPYDALVFPSSGVLSADLREQIGAALSGFADSRDGQAMLQDLLDASGLIPVDAADYGAFRSVINQAHWNMTAAG